MLCELVNISLLTAAECDVHNGKGVLQHNEGELSGGWDSNFGPDDCLVGDQGHSDIYEQLDTILFSCVKGTPWLLGIAVPATAVAVVPDKCRTCRDTSSSKATAFDLLDSLIV